MLPHDTNQTISFDVKINKAEAEQGLKDLNKQVDGLKREAEEGTPKVERLADAVQYAGDVSSETSLTMGQMTGLVLGGTGLIAALTIATIAFYDFIKPIIDAKIEMDNFESTVESTIGKVIKIKSELSNFKVEFDANNLAGAIEDLQKVVDAGQKAVVDVSKGLTLGGVGGIDWWLRLADTHNVINLIGKEGKEQLIVNEKSLDYAKQRVEELKIEKMIMDALVAAGGKLVDQRKKLLELGKPIDSDMTARGLDLPPGDISKFGMKGVRQPRELNWDRINKEARQIVKDQELLIGVMLTGVFTFKDEFINAWGEIFGEANSLFEKLMQNIANTLLEFAAKSAAGAFLNLIIPGLGTAYGALSGGSSGGGNQQVVVVQLGNEELARVVVKGNQEAQRLRLV